MRYCTSSLLKKIGGNVNPFVAAQLNGKLSGSEAIVSIRDHNHPKTNKEFQQGNYICV